MSKFFLILLLAYGAYTFYERRSAPVEAMPADALVIEGNAPYVAVYGRQDCGFTQEMLMSLDRAGIEHRFFSVDEPRVSAPLHARMRQKGLDTSHYFLPVVEVGGQMSVRPEFAQVSLRYRETHGAR